MCVYVEGTCPAGCESMRLCIGSPHSWCMLATNIWILVPPVPLLIRGWRGAEGSGGDSSPESMNLPVSHHRAQCCRSYLQLVHTYLALQHINNSGFKAKHDDVGKFIVALNDASGKQTATCGKTTGWIPLNDNIWEYKNYWETS